MVSASGAEAAALSARARADRVAAGEVTAGGVALHDGSSAGVGDVVITRLNQRRMPVLGGRDFVKNGDLWRVTGTRDDGSLVVTHLGHGGATTLPGPYAAAHVELGYASTVHRAQGLTVDTAHVLVDHAMTRESLYVAMSRGRVANHAYVVTEETVDIDLHHQPPPPTAAADVLRGVLAREGTELSATETIRDNLTAAESLSTLIPRYLDALGRAVATPVLEADVRAGLRDAGGRALEQRASDGPAWRRLLMACAAQDHPREAIAVAVRSELLDRFEPEQVAGVLARRVARTGADEGDGGRMPFRPPWLDPPPVRLVSDPVAVWALTQDHAITSRVQALVEAVVTNPPAWAKALTPPPELGPDRDRWDRNVAIVAAFRDQNRIPDDATHPALLSTGASDEARAAVAFAWSRLQPESPAPSPNERIRVLAAATDRPRPDRKPLPRPALSRNRPDDRPPPWRYPSGPRL